ncbi:MAG: hypothetical protein HY692_01735 [Cyanobacteria bacterium NC_groundwater_1444_Ag_S-0.65um_54_12]|nr:hypothetical protein [Cyanobacteria bacterium NC_groundwater_1444_Ag_S-0.65um_54_12]
MGHRRPVSLPVRALAASAYLAPIAILLLLLPAYRQIRLIRLHSLVSVLLTVGMLVIVLLLGSLHGLPFEFLILAGILLSGAILIFSGCAIWGAASAYQGRSPGIPLLTLLARRWERLLRPKGETR